MSLCRAV
jgi:hypothetical protein